MVMILKESIMRANELEGKGIYKTYASSTWPHMGLTKNQNPCSL